MLADRLTLPTDTVRRVLTPEDLARIDAYHGGATDLHDLLPAVLPLATPRWYETTLTAQHGTVMTLGYLAEPDEAGIRVSLTVAREGTADRLSYGPVVVTPTEMHRPDGVAPHEWREIRAAAGIIIRALLLGL